MDMAPSGAARAAASASAHPPVTHPEPESGPDTPTIADASERPVRSIHVPRLALLAPLAAGAAYLLIALRPAPPAGDDNADIATRAAAAREVGAEGANADGEREAASEDMDGSEHIGVTQDLAATNDTAAAHAVPGPVESPAVVAVNIAELERTREQARRAAEQLEDARRRVKVVLYSTERCTRCVEARSHLVAQGIHPTERDVDKDPRARARHRALSRKGGLPTIEVDGKVLVGFHPERLDQAIERATAVRLKRKR